MAENAFATFGGTVSGIFKTMFLLTKKLNISVDIKATMMPTNKPAVPKYFKGKPFPASDDKTGVKSTNDAIESTPADNLSTSYRLAR